MSVNTWHIIGLLIIGYAIGYWFRMPGDATLGKIYKAG